MFTRVLTTALDFDGRTLRILDQRWLPQEERWVEVRDPDHMVEIIRTLAVRGAPLLGVAAALELARWAARHPGEQECIRSAAKVLRDARPTAVNLAAAIDRMLLENPTCDADGLGATAQRILDEDIAMCAGLARHGELLLSDGDGVLTICNSGSLATAGIGSALGVITHACQQGRKLHVYACETRPLLQGARLTAWELARAGVPHTLICDSMAATLMAAGRIQKVLVGADRIARNGDFANKIGTYALAVLAHHHRVPFYAVAPSSTVDQGCADGSQIPIEERSSEEVRGASGSFGRVQWAPSTAPVFNPAFDVTPRSLVTGILLEDGLMAQAAVTPTHDHASVVRLLSGVARAREVLGGDPATWTSIELGDGNVNMLYRVSGAQGAVMVKQAVPYLRCVGSSWPLSVQRAHFEAMALSEFRRHAPAHVPELIHFDPGCSSLVMEFLEPHVVLRKGLIRGMRFPLLADHLSSYLAAIAIATSEVGSTSTSKRQLAARFAGNTDLCRITEDLVFTDPYRHAPHNRWTTPQLDDLAARFRADKEAKTAILELKRRFQGAAEALIHGDFHSGSIMLTQASTQVIDPEFAVYGPIGFDPGLLIGNLLLAYFSQPGHETFEGERCAYQEWILQVIEELWSGFSIRYHQGCKADQGGERIAKDWLTVQDQRALLPMLAGSDLDRIFNDVLGFAAAEMIRRILGLAHVEDLEAIADPALRARCERQALTLARDLLIHRAHYQQIGEVIARARVVASGQGQQVHDHG